MLLTPGAINQGRLAFSCSPDDAALVTLVSPHVVVAAVCDGEDVRGQFSQTTPVVQAHLIRRVDGQQLIRVHGHQHRADVRLIKEKRKQDTG